MGQAPIWTGPHGEVNKGDWDRSRVLRAFYARKTR